MPPVSRVHHAGRRVSPQAVRQGPAQRAATRRGAQGGPACSKAQAATDSYVQTGKKPTTLDVLAAIQRGYPAHLGHRIRHTQLPQAARGPVNAMYHSFRADFPESVELYEMHVKRQPFFVLLGQGDDYTGVAVFNAGGKLLKAASSDLTPDDPDFWHGSYEQEAPQPPPKPGSPEAAMNAITRLPNVLGVDWDGSTLTVGLEHNTKQARAAIEAMCPGIHLAFMGQRAWDFQNE